MDQKEKNEMVAKAVEKIQADEAAKEAEVVGSNDLTSQIKSIFAEMQKEVKEVVAPAVAPVVKELALNTRYNKCYNQLIGYKETEVDQAFDDGMWFKATFQNDVEAKNYCDSRGIVAKAMSTTNNAAVIPDQLINRIIVLTNQYGVIRKNSKVYNATSGSMDIPKNNADTTAYYTTEGITKTDSDATTQLVEVTIKTLAVVTKLNMELIQDSVIDMISYVVDNMAKALAFKQDSDGFYGDGSAGDGGITGIIPAIEAVGPTNQSIVNPDTNDGTWASIDGDDFREMMGRLSESAWKANDVKWYCSSAFYHQVMNRVKGAGGTDIASMENGYSKNFLGYQVEITSILPSSDAANPSSGEDYCLFGSMQTVAALADRMGKTVKQTTEGAAMLANQTWLLSELRWGYTVHDQGTTTEAGSMILLQS